MRFLLSILGLLLVLQPVSWAFGAPMYLHGQMDHESAIPTMLMSSPLKEHCKYGVGELSSVSEMDELDDLQEGHLALNCFVAGTAAAVSIAAATETVEPMILATVFQPANSSFLSRTESPEIRPPHSIRS